MSSQRDSASCRTVARAGSTRRPSCVRYQTRPALAQFMSIAQNSVTMSTVGTLSTSRTMRSTYRTRGTARRHSRRLSRHRQLPTFGEPRATSPTASRWAYRAGWRRMSCPRWNRQFCARAPPSECPVISSRRAEVAAATTLKMWCAYCRYRVTYDRTMSPSQGQYSE